MQRNLPGMNAPADACIPVESNSNLLNDLKEVWGNSVGLDPDSTTTIILTVAGGIAGNSVRINAAMVGELRPDLQLAVVRDTAPALCRGLQRLLATSRVRSWNTSRSMGTSPRIAPGVTNSPHWSRASTSY